MAVFMIFFLCLALLLGPILHSVVPHSHGADGSESTLWQSIHSALHSEQKKMLFTVTDAVPLFAFLYIVLFIALPRYVFSRRLLRIEHSLQALLCSGRLRYRMFG